MTEEPAMTGALAALMQIDGLSATVGEEFSLDVRVLDSSGAESGETQLGPDMCVVFRISSGDAIVTKGFLIQAKRLGTSGLRFRPALGKGVGSHSHWLWHGSRARPLPRSGTIGISRPSRLLYEQCTSMLQVTPDAFVLVYGTEVSIVSAAAVKATFAKPSRTRQQTELGTKSLPDFVANALDCFIGDESIRAWDNESLLEVARTHRARTALLLDLKRLQMPLDEVDLRPED